MPQRPITPEDLQELAIVGDPQVSPDGRRIVLTVKTIDADANTYRSHLWLYDRDRDTLRPFTSGDVTDREPRFAPDGRRIAFLRTQDHRTQIWTMPVDGGEARQLTELEEGSPSGLDWSPDGDRLVFAFRPKGSAWTRDAQKDREEQGRSTPPRVHTRLHYRFDGIGYLDEPQHLRVADADTGELTPLTDSPYDDQAPAWSPNGDRIAFVSNRSDDPDTKPYLVDLWTIAPDGSHLHRVETPIGPKTAPSWAPDGSAIAYLGTEVDANDPWLPQHNRLWVVSPEGGDARSLTESLDRPVGNVTLSDTREAFASGSGPRWAPDGRTLYVPVSEEGSCRLYAVARDGRTDPTPLTAPDGDLAAVDVGADGHTVAASVADPTRPTELFIGELPAPSSAEGLDLQPASRFNEAWRDHVALSEPEEIAFASEDGTEIQGWLLGPPDFDPQRSYPLLLYIHGGPHAQYGRTFFHEFQGLAAQGYVVLYTNPRGSSGRSEHFMNVIRGQWGELDYQDLMAAADYGASLPYVDAARMAVAGGSYGGYMTNWIIGHTDRFACAITDRCVANLASMAGTSDIELARPDGYWRGSPWDEPKPLWQQSPLSYAANVRTPTLIIHSEGDRRCPIEQAEQWFAALTRLGVETVFVRYPEETSHGMSRNGPPDLRLDRLQRIGDWLAHHLSG